jgi:hypothetical protein
MVKVDEDVTTDIAVNPPAGVAQVGAEEPLLCKTCPDEPAAVDA